MRTSIVPVEADGPFKAADAPPVQIVVLAWLYIGLAMAGLIAGGCLCLQVWLIPGWLGETFLAFAIPIFIFVSMVLLLPALVGGIGLLHGKIWARIIIFLLSIAMVFVFPIGTILGGYSILALRAEQAPSANPAVESGAARYRFSRAASLVSGTFLGLAGFAAICIIVMGLLFQDRPDISPVNANTFDGAVVILIGVAIATTTWSATSLAKRAAGKVGRAGPSEP